jgi:hypothetical protein
VQIDGGQIALVFIGGGVGLVGKIIWDWLNGGNRRKNGNGGDGNIALKAEGKALIEVLQGITSTLNEIRKDTCTSRDDVKELKVRYGSDINEFKQVVQQNFTINTKMMVVLDNLSTRLEKIL